MCTCRMREIPITLAEIFDSKLPSIYLNNLFLSPLTVRVDLGFSQSLRTLGRFSSVLSFRQFQLPSSQVADQLQTKCDVYQNWQRL
jgi:hypothetical protein